MATPPTLVDLDSFAHQTAQGVQSGTTFTGIYDTVTAGSNFSFDTTTKRLTAHVASLKCIEPGNANTNVQRTLPASTRLLVTSFYVRVSAAPASGAPARLFLSGGPTNSPVFGMDTSGHLSATIAGGTVQTTSGTFADSAWHRIDLRFDTSGTTYTIDWQVDGTAQTQASRASQTAADMTTATFGTTTSTNNLTFWVQDFVASVTTGDYPIGEHFCGALYPNAEGTDVLGSTNAITFVGASTGWQCTNAWNGGTPGTSIYVTYASTTTGDAASNYAEVNFTNPSGGTVWDSQLVLAGFASGTAANTADARVVLSDNTAVSSTGLLDYSGSTTVLGTSRKFLARPSGGWTTTNLAGVKARWGFSTDTSPLPRLAALLVEYAGPDTKSVAHSTNASVLLTSTKTHSVAAVIQKSATVTHSADAVVKVAGTSKTHSADAVILHTATATHSADGVVLKVTARTHATDAVIKVSGTTQSHAADGIIAHVATIAHTVAAVIKKTASITHDADATVLKSRIATQNADAVVLVAGLAETHDVDSIILRSNTITQDADALVVLTATTTHGVDGHLLFIPHSTHETDAVVLATLTLIQNVDADIFGTVATSHDADALIILQGTLQHGADAEVAAVVAHRVLAYILSPHRLPWVLSEGETWPERHGQEWPLENSGEWKSP